MTDKNVAIRMMIDGQVRDVSYQELALSNNLAQESLVRLLIEKNLFTAKELVKMIETVRRERYRTPDDVDKNE